MKYEVDALPAASVRAVWTALVVRNRMVTTTGAFATLDATLTTTSLALVWASGTDAVHDGPAAVVVVGARVVAVVVTAGAVEGAIVTGAVDGAVVGADVVGAAVVGVVVGDDAVVVGGLVDAVTTGESSTDGFGSAWSLPFWLVATATPTAAAMSIGTPAITTRRRARRGTGSVS